MFWTTACHIFHFLHSKFRLNRSTCDIVFRPGNASGTPCSGKLSTLEQVEKPKNLERNDVGNVMNECHYLFWTVSADPCHVHFAALKVRPALC